MNKTAFYRALLSGAKSHNNDNSNAQHAILHEAKLAVEQFLGEHGYSSCAVIVSLSPATWALTLSHDAGKHLDSELIRITSQGGHFVLVDHCTISSEEKDHEHKGSCTIHNTIESLAQAIESLFSTARFVEYLLHNAYKMKFALKTNSFHETHGDGFATYGDCLSGHVWRFGIGYILSIPRESLSVNVYKLCDREAAKEFMDDYDSMICGRKSKLSNSNFHTAVIQAKE